MLLSIVRTQAKPEPDEGPVRIDPAELHVPGVVEYSLSTVSRVLEGLHAEKTRLTRSIAADTRALGEVETAIAAFALAEDRLKTLPSDKGRAG